MRVVTDDERREVAERLRAYGARPYPNFNIALILCAMGIDLIEHLERRHGDSELFDRLADLIDPGDTSQGCRDTVACDREGLARLARLLIVTADGYQIDYPHTMRTRVATDALRDFARSIYKALGEVAE